MKMGIKEFRERLGQLAEGDETVTLTNHGRIVGHYAPVDGRKVSDDNLERWLSARQRFRARWESETPDWEERLCSYGLDSDGEPFENEPRSTE